MDARTDQLLTSQKGSEWCAPFSEKLMDDPQGSAHSQIPLHRKKSTQRFYSIPPRGGVLTNMRHHRKASRVLDRAERHCADRELGRQLLSVLLHRSILPPSSSSVGSLLFHTSFLWRPSELVPRNSLPWRWCFLLSSYLSIPHDTLCAFTTARAAVCNLPITAHTLVFLVRRPSPLIIITLYLFEQNRPDYNWSAPPELHHVSFRDQPRQF